MSVQTFIAQIAPIIQKEAKKRGYKVCSTTIAQAIIESRYGESGLAKYHNYFGLKCGSAWKGKSVNMKTKEEYTVGTLTTIKDNFRAYDSMEEGVVGYFDFISTNRYANLKQATNYKQFAEFLKADGYATSSTYVNTLCNTVIKNGLEQFDDTTVISNTKPTLRTGDKNSYVMHVQKYLLTKGYAVGTADGVYGPKTTECVKQYQKDHNLTIDGIWGPQCWASVN